MATKKVKIFEIFAEVSDDEPTPRYVWEIKPGFSLHTLLGLIIHIKTDLKAKLMAMTHQGSPQSPGT